VIAYDITVVVHEEKFLKKENVQKAGGRTASVELRKPGRVGQSESQNHPRLKPLSKMRVVYLGSVSQMGHVLRSKSQRTKVLGSLE